MPNQTAIRAQRLAAVQRWLLAEGWTTTATTFDYAPIVARASKWYADKRRAESLVAKAARRLRGDAVREAGRPRSVLVACPYCGKMIEWAELEQARAG